MTRIPRYLVAPQPGMVFQLGVRAAGQAAQHPVTAVRPGGPLVSACSAHLVLRCGLVKPLTLALGWPQGRRWEAGRALITAMR